MAHNQLIAEPNISFHPSKVVLFDRILTASGQPFRRGESVQMPKSNHHNGVMSISAARAIREKINWLVEVSTKKKVVYPNGAVSHNFRIAFLTFTLPSKQIHTDLEIKEKCWNQLLTELRQKFGMQNYVWKAELQKNDNIHFHLTTDTFLDHRTVRIMWNRIIGKLGYIREYQKAMRRHSFASYSKMRSQNNCADPGKVLEAWERGNRDNWTNPNSTDVKTVFKVRNLASYMAKYMSKKVAKDATCPKTAARLKAFGGRIWFCSRSLSRLKAYVCLQSNKAMNFFSRLANVVGQRLVEFDYCTVLYLDRLALPPPLQEKYTRLLYLSNQLSSVAPQLF